MKTLWLMLFSLHIASSYAELTCKTRSLWYWIEKGDVELFKKKYIAQLPCSATALNANEQSLLWYAASFKRDEIIKFLIRQGAEINLRSCGAMTPLMIASHFLGKQRDLDDAGRSVLALIAGGADLNAIDDNGMTALMHASEENQFAIAQILLEVGANDSLRSIDGRTAIEYNYIWEPEYGYTRKKIFSEAVQKAFEAGMRYSERQTAIYKMICMHTEVITDLANIITLYLRGDKACEAIPVTSEIKEDEAPIESGDIHKKCCIIM